ncbi:MAG TPA: maleylacetoacetate isomerase [Candidatus Acidoferrales bacterium]|nr:maleylacetoacetate isomerase [Candidatus Acidoferrales bacterium]
MKLYTYFRSSSSYRVRIALHLKQIPYEPVFVHLRKGEQKRDEFRAVNPQSLVPVLIDGERVLTQSLAIIEYLEERYPEPPLLPRDSAGRARVRALASLIACEMQPLNNLRVLDYLAQSLGHSEAECRRWYCHWIAQGFAALEALLAAPETGTFCHGDSPTVADAFLVPQVFNARRFGCDLAAYPTVGRIDAHCAALAAFRAAAPENQPDFEKG